MNSTKLFFLFVFISFSATTLTAQEINYSNPEVVAEKFLDLFYKGQWYDAAKFCGVTDCQNQMDIMMRKMALDDVEVINGECEIKITKIEIDPSLVKAKCFYTKTCSKANKPFSLVLNLIKTGEKWLVEYIFKRDKYL